MTLEEINSLEANTRLYLVAPDFSVVPINVAAVSRNSDNSLKLALIVSAINSGKSVCVSPKALREFYRDKKEAKAASRKLRRNALKF